MEIKVEEKLKQTNVKATKGRKNYSDEKYDDIAVKHKIKERKTLT